jgi:hypothetical protein
MLIRERRSLSQVIGEVQIADVFGERDVVVGRHPAEELSILPRHNVSPL